MRYLNYADMYENIDLAGNVKPLKKFTYVLYRSHN